MTSSRLRAFLSASKAIAAALSSVFLTPAARAGIQPTHWYRMGEETQPLPAAGSAATVLHDTLAAADLDASSSPPGYCNSLHIGSSGIPSTSADTVGSFLCFQTRSRGAYAQGSLLSTDTTDFGIELWFIPTTSTGTGCLFYNGTPGVDGWGLYVTDNKFGLRIGRATYPDIATVNAGNWQNIALAYRGGVMSFYLNGAKISSVTQPILTPTGHFTLGATAGASDDDDLTDFCPGGFDELRSFKITSAFDPYTDLLYHAPQIAIDAIFNGSGDPGILTMELGVANVGTEITQSFTIANHHPAGASPSLPSLGPLRIDSITLSGPDAAGFTLDPPSPPAVPLLAGEGASYTIHFTPTSNGPHSATATIVSNDPDEGTFSIVFNVTGVTEPRLTIYSGSSTSSEGVLFPYAPAQVFSRADPGSPSGEEKTFLIQNSGIADLHLSGVSFAGTNPDDFILSRPPGRTTLPPGEETTLAVRFSPTAPGSRRALLVLDSDDRYSPSFHLALAGTATGPEIQLTSADGSLLSSGQVVSWGYTQSDIVNRPADADLGGITAISVGNGFTLALQRDGTIAAWGVDDSGQLAIPPLGEARAVAISAGFNHALAVKSDGTVIAWGDPADGKTEVPAGLTGVTAVAAGWSHSLALKSDGTVVAWGNPADGEIAVPDDLSGVTAIAADFYHSVALKSDGTVVTWGFPVGSGSIAPPAGLSGVIAIAAGDFGDSFALRADGSIVRWGPLLTPDKASTLTIPSGPSDIVALTGNYDSVAAIRRDGTLLLSGYDNSSSQLNPPAGLRGVTAAAIGYVHLSALHDSVIDFGSVDTARASTPKILTVRNSGAAPLHLTGASFFTGPDAVRFSLGGDGALPTTLAPDGTATTVAVTALPGATTGTLRATLHLLSDAAGHPDFTVQLTAAAVTATDPYTAWQLHYFASTAATGPSADDADPNHNGIPNLLEYALGRDPVATGSASTGTLPNYVFDSSNPSIPRFGFDYDRAATGITLEIQGSDALSGDWTPLARSTGGPAFTSLTTPALQLSETAASTGSAPTGLDTDLRHLTLTASPTRYLRLQATRP